MSFPRKAIVLFAALSVIAGLCFVAFGFGNSKDAAAAEPSTSFSRVSDTQNNPNIPIPSSMIGDWHQVSSGLPKAVMNASITESKIEITLTMQNTTGIFWTGTFDTSQSTDKPFATVSKGDVEAMTMEMYASSEKTKLFTYKDGELSFQFSIMGVSTTVFLSK